MSERKAINKYYPANFDPRCIPKRPSRSTEQQKENLTRANTPFAVRCTSCGEYVSKGRKFNARKSRADGNYLGIPITLISHKCPGCCALISFKTDSKTQDYICEHGAQRLGHREPWRVSHVEETTEEHLARLEEEIEKKENGGGSDTIEELETRAEDAKMQMAVADGLVELQARNARADRRARRHLESVLVAEPQENDQDTEIARRAFATKNTVMEVESGDEYSSSEGIFKQKRRPRRGTALCGKRKKATPPELVSYSSN